MGLISDLTNEELAELEAAWNVVPNDYGASDSAELVLDLIAAIRSSRGEVERLRAALWRAPEDWLKNDDEAWFALTGERLA